MRLTQPHRRNIIADALKHAFEKRFGEIEEAITDVARRGLRKRLGEEHCKLYDVIPPEWLSNSNVFVRTADGWSAAVYGLHVPHNLKTIYLRGKLSEELTDILNRKRQLEADKSRVKAQLEARLNSISTVKQLVEAWPEGEPFYKHLMMTKPQLPSVQFADLNSMLDLPIEDTTT